MAQAKIELLADSRQIRTATNDLKRLEGQGRSTERGANALKSAFVALGGALAAQRVIQYADAYKSLQNQLRIVTNDSENLLAVTQALSKVSEDSRSSLDVTAGLYSKLARSTSELGLSQGELVRITETINKTFAVSGATAEEAGNAITQLAQGLSAGALRGDEFNSVAEQAPGLLRAVAQETGLAVGELRAFAAEGKITTELVIRSLQNYSSTVDAEFSSANVTVSQGVNQLKNDFTLLVGAFDDATGTTSAVSRGIGSISESLQDLTDIINSGAISGPFAAQFEAVIGDVNSFTNLLNQEFSTFFSGVSVAADETGVRLGDAFQNIVPNVRSAIQIVTVELAAFIDQLDAYSVAVAQTLNPFDDVDSRQALNQLEDRRDILEKIRLEALSDIVVQNTAEKNRVKIAIEGSKSLVEQFKAEREARISNLANVQNGGAATSAQIEGISPTRESGDAQEQAQGAERTAATLAALRAEVAAYNAGSEALARFNAEKALGAEATAAQIEEYVRLRNELDGLKGATVAQAETMQLVNWESFGDRAAGAFASVAAGFQTSEEAARALAAGILQEVIGSLIRTQIQALVTNATTAASSTATVAATTGAAVAGAGTAAAASTGAAAAVGGTVAALAGTVGAAWAPAAALASLATLGANAVPAQAAIISTVGVALASQLVGGLISNIITAGTGFAPGGGMSPRAQGGQVMRDKPYLVGERGPELFTPSASGGGRITPFNQLMRESSQTNNNQQTANVNINIPRNSDDDIARVIRKQMPAIASGVQRFFNNKGVKIGGSR